MLRVVVLQILTIIQWEKDCCISPPVAAVQWLWANVRFLRFGSAIEYGIADIQTKVWTSFWGVHMRVRSSDCRTAEERRGR